MRRQRRTNNDDDYYPTSLHTESDSPLTQMEDFIQMERVSSKGSSAAQRFENTIEAKIQDGDTLQALALRFHCTVADIKRLNKIDKENEIFARKVIKIPVTVHSLLVGAALPGVHKSGNNSPKATQNVDEEHSMNNILRNPLLDEHTKLGEKLMVASVNASGTTTTTMDSGNVNNIIFNSKLTGTYTDNDPEVILSSHGESSEDASPLLGRMLDNECIAQPRPLRGPALRALDWSGSDCDMSWVCLFVVILALCFVIPLIYVIYLAEHPHHHNTTSH